MPAQTAAIASNVESVRERIAQAAARAGRRAEEITLVAVSKTFPADSIRAAYAAGLRHFGENRVQEWESKQPLLKDLDATWHLVGHLQSNKVGRAVQLFDAIDSVDSVSLAEKLAHARATAAAVQAETPGTSPGGRVRETRLPVLIEVRLDVTSSKSGAEEGDLARLAETIVALPGLDLRGLMTIPPYFDDPEQARPYFRRLRELRDDLQIRAARPLPDLSMGMSHDFAVAIEEGATQIRLGTALFGLREAAGTK
jgi:pyridoxal phosphate enzyme (YggS family)